MDGRQALEPFREAIELGVVFAADGGVILLEKEFHRGQQPDNLFLANLGDAAEVVVGRRAGIGLANPLLLAHEDAAALGPAQILAATVGDHVAAHLHELAQVLGGWNLGGGIENQRQVVLVTEFEIALQRDLVAHAVVTEDEGQGRGLLVDCFRYIRLGIDVDQLHAYHAEGMVKGATVGRLDHDFALHARQVG